MNTRILTAAGKALAADALLLSVVAGYQRATWPAAGVWQANDPRITYSVNPGTGTQDWVRFDDPSAFGGFYYRATFAEGQPLPYFTFRIPFGVTKISMQGIKNANGGRFQLERNGVVVVDYPAEWYSATTSYTAEYLTTQPNNQLTVAAGDFIKVTFLGFNPYGYSNQITLS